MKPLKKLLIVFLALLLPVGCLLADEVMDPALKDKAKRLADDGLRYLREAQAEDGSWSGSVGVTALALYAYLDNRRGYNESDGPFITRPIEYLLKHVNEDGSISETNHNRNYNTAVVITALQATGNPYYGGVGYGGDERPDLSNMYFALEAMHSTGFDKQDPLWEKAMVFVSRSQNNSETNDQEWAANDGGFAYMPGYSPHGEAVSYGGMTHAGMLSLLFAGVDKNDPRVKAAHDWIQANYTLDSNPGAKESQGLFYYYNAFAKSMYAYGDAEITDAQGAAHNWRNDLTRKLASLQNKDGSWVNVNSGRWWEGDKNLVTAWSVIALNYAIKKP